MPLHWNTRSGYSFFYSPLLINIVEQFSIKFPFLIGLSHINHKPILYAIPMIDLSGDWWRQGSNKDVSGRDADVTQIGVDVTNGRHTQVPYTLHRQVGLVPRLTYEWRDTLIKTKGNVRTVLRPIPTG